MKWMIYGATGYTGRRIARHFHRHTCREVARPILGGRDDRTLAALANDLQYEHRSFSLDCAQGIDDALVGIDLVLNTAGPFSHTCRALLDACLRTGTHYLDLSGELRSLAAVYEADEAARQRGVLLLPAIGFSVVPLDCLAARLKQALPNATRMELAFDGYRLSTGTAKTYIEALGRGSARRVGGKLIGAKLRWREQRVRFDDRPARVISVPYGELCSVFHSTGIGNIDVMMAPNPQLRLLFQYGLPWLSLLNRPWLGRIVARGARLLFRKPEHEPTSRRFQLWARAGNAQAEAVVAIASTEEPYDFTVRCVADIIGRLHSHPLRTGAFTPSQLFGWQLLDELGGDIRLSRLPP